jgi:hypothetical protein
MVWAISLASTSRDSSVTTEVVLRSSSVDCRLEACSVVEEETGAVSSTEVISASVSG